ncbi:MAG: hypothetical protein KJN98_06650, partial [Pontiella sp.]|nr:hypothetical protein [Pontiella sp.]
SGTGMNHGSKVVFAASGEAFRTLKEEPPKLEIDGTHAVVMPGVLAVSGPAFSDYDVAPSELETLAKKLEKQISPDDFPLVVLCDDPEFCAVDFDNFLWVTFTRSNPSHDIHGVGAKTRFKHWGCNGSLIIDARLKPHHAPPLVEDSSVTTRVSRMFAAGGVLEKWA